MNRIYWITPECFLDVDMPILKELANEYSINWLVIGFGVNSRGMFKKKEIEFFAFQNNLLLEIQPQNYRFSDFRIIGFYLKQSIKIKNLKPQLVYTSYLGEPLFLLLLRSFVNKRKIVVALHDVQLHSSEKYKAIKNKYYKLIRHIYINFHLFSNSQAKIFNQFVPNKNVHVIPLCLKDFGSSKQIKKGNYVNFLFFGSIYAYKGLNVLLESINILVEKYNQTHFKLHIYGKCETKEINFYLKYIKHNVNIEWINETILNEAVPDIFAKVDYIIFPYLDVTQCGPLMIAKNYGVPAICSDLPGFRDYIENNKTGFLFKPEDAADLSNILLKCIQHPQWNELHQNIIQESSTIYSPKSISHIYKRFFNSIAPK